MLSRAGLYGIAAGCHNHLVRKIRQRR